MQLLDESSHTSQQSTVIDIGLLFFYIYAIPWQVYLSCKGQSSNEASTDLQKLLESPTGSEYFQLYLGTEYGMENLIFYKAVMEWKALHGESSEDTREHANKLINTFYRPGSLLELNLGNDEKGQVYLDVAKSSIPVETFDKSAAVVHRYLVQSFQRFKRSTFYRLYTGKLNPDMRSSAFSNFLDGAKQIDSDSL